jgi:hypothetical protein
MENVRIQIALIKIYKKEIYQCKQFLPLPEAEIEDLLHSSEADLGYFLAWVHSLQLPSTQAESPLAPKCHVSF